MPNSKYPFMRSGLKDTYGILELQNKILEIALYLDKFCKEHQITYYLMGVSALGAMRHDGFIPWDDDLDVFMDFKNYQKFIKACQTDLDTEHFYFQREDSTELPYFFSKLRMNGTACIEETWKHRKDIHQGIFIDIMCLNNAAPTQLGRKVQYYSAAMLKAKAVSKSNYHTDNSLKKVQLFIAKYSVNCLTKPLLLWLVRRYNNKSTSTLAHIFGRAKFKNSFYPIADFGTPRYVPFETVQLPVPSNVEEYLTIRYGKNYMQMPDEATKAMYQTHAMRWSTTQDYKELLSIYKEKIKIVYTVSNLKRSGPILVLYGIIKNLDRTHFTPIVLTLSDETSNSLKPAFEKLDIEVYCLHKRGISTFLSGAMQFRRIVNQINPDIIHAHGFRDIVLTAFAAPNIYKKYATIHCDWVVDYTLYYGVLMGGICAWLQTQALKKISVRIACSKMLADLLNKKYPFMHFDFVNNGVDTEKFYPVADKKTLRKKLGLPGDKKIVIWAGSFIPRKDPLTMAQAILELAENEYYFVFCGARGPLLEVCKKLLKDRNDVLFTGYITNIEQYYQAADIYVSTSKSEGLPLAVLEAQFCGLVPLLSDIPQHRYILPQEQIDACLYNNTIAGLITKLQVCLYANPDKVLQVCATHIQHFSAKKMSQAYMEKY